MNKELEESKQILENVKDSIDWDCKENVEVRNAISTVLNYIENSIPKEKVEEKIKKARLKMFSTRIMNEQEMYFLDKCVHVINDIQNELLEGK